MAYTTIDDPSAYFQTKLYTGTGSSLALTNDGNSDLQPDWVWVKCRDDSHNHQVFDSVRGVHKRMRTDTDGAETESSESLKSFNTDGFTLGTQANVNNSGNTFVAWNWKKTADIGFDIVSYTGNATARTISHSCGAVPTMIIAKRRSSAESWGVYHVARTPNKFLRLEATNNEPDDESSIWNNTTPTSSVFSVGTSGLCNQNNGTYIAYLFADIKGFSKMGSYVGNGNANGSFIFTGFKPAWIMIKKSTDSANSWFIGDNKRSPFNIVLNYLLADTSDVDESGSGQERDFLSNGFKIRNSNNGLNTSGSTYVYMAFAENPFVTSTGVPATAR